MSPFFFIKINFQIKALLILYLLFNEKFRQLLIKTFEMDFLRAISMTFFTVGIFWNFVGAVFLARIGSVPLNLLIFLIIGSFTGGFFGAHLSKLNGNILIKKTFITVCIMVGISLLIKSIKSFL